MNGGEINTGVSAVIMDSAAKLYVTFLSCNSEQGAVTQLIITFCWFLSNQPVTDKDN